MHSNLLVYSVGKQIQKKKKNAIKEQGLSFPTNFCEAKVSTGINKQL